MVCLARIWLGFRLMTGHKTPLGYRPCPIHSSNHKRIDISGNKMPNPMGSWCQKPTPSTGTGGLVKRSERDERRRKTVVMGAIFWWDLVLVTVVSQYQESLILGVRKRDVAWVYGQPDEKVHASISDNPVGKRKMIVSVEVMGGCSLQG